jgi:UDP-N-acetylglucosamine transferase subunit ALG13
LIFVTVGGQIPFERLVRSVDEWAGERGRSDVFAQIAESDYRPRYIEFAEFLSPQEFRSRVEDAQSIVAHAGMGSILTALEFGKPILVMPRRGHLHETRNDHQYGTAERLKARKLVEVALDEAELRQHLDALMPVGEREPISPNANPDLIAALRGFIEGAGPGK